MKLKPQIQSSEYVYAQSSLAPRKVRFEFLMSFKENNFYTYILEKEIAITNKITFTYPCKWILISAQTELNAVGITYQISKILTSHSISCNVVAGYNHDHIFVPSNLANKAKELIESFTFD